MYDVQLDASDGDQLCRGLSTALVVKNLVKVLSRYILHPCNLPIYSALFTGHVAPTKRVIGPAHLSQFVGSKVSPVVQRRVTPLTLGGIHRGCGQNFYVVWQIICIPLYRNFFLIHGGLNN